MDASSLLTYLTTIRLGDGKWKGTTHAFILHWQDQVRKYHDLAPKQKLPPDLQRTMLENAVYPVPALRTIKTQAEQHKAHTGVDLSYSQYSALLLSAAQQHDKMLVGPSNRYQRRQVYQHEQGDEGSDYDGYSIDSPIDYLSINQSVINNPRPPRLSYDQWHKLTDEAKRTWDLLSDDAKAIILGTATRKPNSAPSAPLPRRRINQHDIQHLVSCLHETGIEDQPTVSTVSNSLHAQTEGSNDNSGFQDGNLAPEEHFEPPPNDQQLLAHVTKRKSLPPGTAKRLMSPSAGASTPRTNPSTNNSQQEINFNGSTYRKVNTTNISYSVSAFKAIQGQASLVDRGANGGVAGSDVRIIAKTTRRVDIQGIDNHRITDIPIVTAGGVVNTQRGEVIAIFHQYAYTGKGRSIHSSGQMEAFKQLVFDKSIKVGGKQRIETVDGYIIPINFRNGLPFINMRPYKDKEWDSLPHVTITGDTDWDPTILDHEMEDEEEWANLLKEPPNIVPDPLFDEVGNYHQLVEVSNALTTSSAIEQAIIKDLPSLYQMYERVIKPRAIDFQKYAQHFIFVPPDIIKRTFEGTTQFYRQSPNPSMKKTYRTPFPACNVQRRSEAVATDTVYSDTPAIDSGITAAQFFVGVESLVCDIYPLQSDKQFINTLQDNITKRGAMSKLISDRAQVEISKKVQDILRHLVIDNWQSEPYQQHQNFAERRYQDVKRMTNRLMDWTGAPNSLWFLAMSYVCYVTNLTANASINYAIPLQVLTGITPDISPILQFVFYEPVYYRAHEPGFPSESKELSGRFVGISENVGHALTFKILNEKSGTVIYCSVV